MVYHPIILTTSLLVYCVLNVGPKNPSLCPKFQAARKSQSLLFPIFLGHFIFFQIVTLYIKSEMCATNAKIYCNQFSRFHPTYFIQNIVLTLYLLQYPKG